MEEGVVRMAAQMYALVADMEAIKTRIKGMELHNLHSEQIYEEGHFYSAEAELETIAQKLRQEI